MNEIEKTEGEIKVLQAKLELLKEIEKHKSPAEEAFKEVYGYYPEVCERSVWVAFQKGYEAAQKDYKVGEYQPTSQEQEDNEWKSVALRFGEKLSGYLSDGYYELSPNAWFRWAVFTYGKHQQIKDAVRESVKWHREHQNESVEDYLKPHTPEQTEKSLREAFKKVQQTEEWKETQRKIDSNYDELVGSETSPQEPTSTVFRQKLFDGIKSVFYDPDYERTHWKMKVDMAVDEVLTHFYDILPEPQNAAGSQNVDVEFLVDGYNDCLNEIKSKLR